MILGYVLQVLDNACSPISVWTLHKPQFVMKGQSPFSLFFIDEKRDEVRPNFIFLIDDFAISEISAVALFL